MKRWTKWVTILPLLVGGCVSASGGTGALEGACRGLAPLADAHAEALETEGSDAAVVTGARLIAGVDGACR